VTEKIDRRSSVELVTSNGHKLKVTGLTESEQTRLGEVITEILRGRP
jgi:hypothetical protein